jgi:translocator protein
LKIKPNHVLVPLITVAVALVGHYFTQGGMEWYKTELILPGLTPPGYVFGIAWTIIFTLTAIAAMVAWNKRPDRSPVIKLFIANAIFNVLWSILFFGYHQIGLALIDLFALGATLFLLIPSMKSCCRKACFLLMPYLLWACFAGYLNFSILLLN